MNVAVFEFQIVSMNGSPPEAGESPVPKVCQNAMFFVPLGLALSVKQIPQMTEM